MARRVVLGRMLDGSFDLRASLPGFDALTSDINNVNRISFSAQWTDVIVVHQIGNVAIAGNGNNGAFLSGTTVHFPALTKIPFVEIRGADGNTIYDDHAAGGGTALAVGVMLDRWQLARRVGMARAFYVVLKEGGVA